MRRFAHSSVKIPKPIEKLTRLTNSAPAYENAVSGMRKHYLSPSLNTFQAFQEPFCPIGSYMQYMWDCEGNQYLDCLAQNLTISVGHGHPRVRAAIDQQLDHMVHCTTMYYNRTTALAAKRLIETLPPRDDGEDWVVHFVNSGSEAVDLALLMARAHTENWDVLTLRNSYHGLHGIAMASTGMSVCKQRVPHSFGVTHVQNPNLFDGPLSALHIDEQIDLYVRDLRETIEYETSGSVAAWMFEQVQGYGGIHMLPPKYVIESAAIVREAGGLVIADEVQSGFGRMRTEYQPNVFWSFELSDIVPDIVVTAKGLGNGLPIAAVMAPRNVANAITERRFFNTYGGNPTVCAASIAVLELTTKDDDFRANALATATVLEEGLATLIRYPAVWDVRGQGLMYGIELDPKRAADIFEQCRHHGVICGLGGVRKNVLRVMPPMCIRPEDADYLLKVIRMAVHSE